MKTITMLAMAIIIAGMFHANAAKGEEEYLWNPTLAWEDSTDYTSISAIKLIKNDEQLIYFADSVIYLRDIKTGKILAQSEKFTDGAVDGFSMSDDFRTIFAIKPAGKNGILYQMDATTLKVKHKTVIPIKALPYQWINYVDGRTFRLDYLSGAYSVSESDFRLIYRAIPPAKAPWEDYEHIFGTCVVKIDPNTDSIDFSRDLINQIIYYEKNRYGTSNNFNNGMLIICDSNSITHFLDKITTKDIYTFNSSRNNFSFSPGAKYLLLYSSDSLLFINMQSKDTVKKYDLNKLSLKAMSDHFLNFDNNINHVFDNKYFPYYYYYYPDFKEAYYYDDIDKRIKLLYNPKFQINTKYGLLATHTASYVNIDTNNHFQAYNLNPKSSIEENNQLIPILKSDSNNLFLPFEESLPKKITIYDNTGKEILCITKDFKITNNEIICEISHLQNGAYLIRVEFENNTSSTFKFIKGY